MKKRYICPDFITLKIQGIQVISFSGVGNSTYNIEYGGLDEDGIIDPSVKIFNDINLWDEEW